MENQPIQKFIKVPTDCQLKLKYCQYFRGGLLVAESLLSVDEMLISDVHRSKRAVAWEICTKYICSSAADSQLIC